MGEKNLSVLIVDDNAHMRSMLLQVVKSTGIERVYFASDGAEALKTLREHGVDILITDMAMEPMDGIELVKRIRKSPESANRMIPVLMITGHMTITRIQEARDAGVNEFVAKPISVKAVLGRLEAIIERPRDFIDAPSYFGPDRRRRKDPAYTGPRRRRGDSDPKA